MKTRKGMIILLCRNALTYSRKCLQTLIGQTYPCEILVVDNASSDGTARYMAAMQARTPGLFRMSFHQVTSVARCWNEALAWSWLRGHKEALVVNNDTELLPRTYEILLAHLQASTHGMVTAVGVDGVEKKPAYPEEIVERYHPDYSCFMMTNWAHKHVPFDQYYDGGYLEDSKSHASLHRAGIRAVSINLGFLHHSSGTIKTADAAEQARINHHFTQNKERFYREFGCVPGTKGYEDLFTEDKFGVRIVVASNA